MPRRRRRCAPESVLFSRGSTRQRFLKFGMVIWRRLQSEDMPVARSRLVNRNIVAGRGRTSMRLEPELWDALLEICRREAIDPGKLVRRVEEQGHAGGRTSAVRVFLLNYFRAAATEDGHLQAGHGSSGVPRPQALSAAEPVMAW
jgi:predicted DNA-binding ribbon-helix-helix protein